MHIFFFKRAECTAILISNWKNNTIFTFSNNEKFKQWENLIIQLQPCLQGSIVWTPPPLPSFWLPPPEGGIWKNKKRGWKYGAEAGLLEGGSDWHFSYLIFSRFIIFKFRNYFTLCNIVLRIWRKIIFFCHHNFMKKVHSKLSKNELENIP